MTDGCGIGKQSNRETRVVINYLQFPSSIARVSSSENKKIAISQQVSQKMKKIRALYNKGTLFSSTFKVEGKKCFKFLISRQNGQIWLFCRSYKIITIDDFNSVEIDENGDDDDSKHYFYIIDAKICQKKRRTKKNSQVKGPS